MNKQDRKEYMKAYYQAHKQDRKAYKKAYYQAHREQAKAYRQAHKEDSKAKMKAWYESHKAEHIAYMKAYNKAHKDQIKAWFEAHKEDRKEYMKAYIQADVNANGETKHNIRIKSQRILKQMNLNIPGYEIHHCFGYEDASKFIYCSKSLHLKIHQFLRDHGIDASTDHWMQIRDLVNSSDEFWYIKC